MGWKSELFCCHCLILQNTITLLIVGLARCQLLLYHPSWSASLVRHLMESLAERKQKTAKLPLCHLSSTQQKKQVASLNRWTVSAVAGAFPWECQAEKTRACSQTYVQELGFCVSAEVTPSPRPHIQIFSMKAFHGSILWYFVSLSCSSDPLTEKISTAADPQQDFLKYLPHECHQQITQENMEKGYKVVLLSGQQIATVLFFQK